MEYQFQFNIILNYLPAVFDGLWLTLALSMIGIFGGFALGLGGALASLSSHFLLRWVARVYVEVTRNTPLLVQLFVIFFGLPSLGIRLSPLTSAFVALVFNNGGYIAEIMRAGIQSTHKSQTEAAESLGLTYAQTLRYVVLPPALEKVYQPIVSQSVLLMLSTSIVSAIGVEDLTGAANLISSDSFKTIEIYLIMSVIYLVLNFLFRFMLAGAGLVVFTRSRRMLFRRT